MISTGKSVSQVALRWLIQKDVVSSVVMGVKTVEQLESNMGAAYGWKLTDSQVSSGTIPAPHRPIPHSCNVEYFAMQITLAKQF